MSLPTSMRSAAVAWQRVGCLGPCMVVFTGTFIGMRVDRNVRMGMHIGMHTAMHIGMRIDMCIDMREAAIASRVRYCTTGPSINS